jgi:hypothetical protein
MYCRVFIITSITIMSLNNTLRNIVIGGAIALIIGTLIGNRERISTFIKTKISEPILLLQLRQLLLSYETGDNREKAKKLLEEFKAKNVHSVNKVGSFIYMGITLCFDCFPFAGTRNASA